MNVMDPSKPKIPTILTKATLSVWGLPQTVYHSDVSLADFILQSNEKLVDENIINKSKQLNLCIAPCLQYDALASFDNTNRFACRFQILVQLNLFAARYYGVVCKCGIKISADMIGMGEVNG